MPFLVFWKDNFCLKSLSINVYTILCTSTQSYFIFRVQFFEVFQISLSVEYVLCKCSFISIIRIHLKITEPMLKSGFFLSRSHIGQDSGFSSKIVRTRRDWDGWTVWKLQCKCSLNKMPYRNNVLISCQLTNNNHCYILPTTVVL